MRKFDSQIGIALVCVILGFMVSYQFKVLMKQEKDPTVASKISTEITVQIEGYKKQKSELEKKINELQGKIKQYEEAAAGKSDTNKNLVKELEDTRLINGTVDVKGPGVVVYLTPNTQVFGNNMTVKLNDLQLAKLVNELRFAGAEAISINDIRVTSQTGIRNAGDYIMIGDDKISPSKRVELRAIGDKALLSSGLLDFPEIFADFKGIWDSKVEKSDDIVIKKYTKSYKMQYAKPAKQ